MAYSNGLTPKDFDEIEQLALEVRIDYELFEPYIDMKEFLEKSLGAEIKYYSQMNEEEYDKSYSFSNNGFTVFEIAKNGNIKPIVYINDNLPKGNQIFTMAHESKHIIKMELNPTMKNEKEADYFAKVFIAPKSLSIFYKIFDLESIIKTYGLSFEAAVYYKIALDKRIEKYGLKYLKHEEEFINNVISAKET